MQAKTSAGGVAQRLAVGFALASALTVSLTACSSGGGGSTATGAPSSSASASSPASTGSGGGSGGGSATGASDPCQLVTAAEASHLMGKTLSQTLDKGGICTYSAGATVVTVTLHRVPGGATPAQAQAYYNKAVSQFSKQPGLTLTDPGIGEKSLAGKIDIPGVASIAGIAFLQGTAYVAIEAAPATSMAALKSLATVALGRV